MTMKSSTGTWADEHKLPEAWAGIEAKPLLTLDVINEVVPRNSALELRWVNRIAGDGLRFNQMLAGGFVAAKADELWLRTGHKPIPLNMVKEGKVLYGDLIAMLISKAAYQGALKHNAMKAIELGDRLRLKDTIAPAVRQNILGRVPSDMARKITTFVPSEKEVDQMSENNEKEGQKLG